MGYEITREDVEVFIDPETVARRIATLTDRNAHSEAVKAYAHAVMDASLVMENDEIRKEAKRLYDDAANICFDHLETGFLTMTLSMKRVNLYDQIKVLARKLFTAKGVALIEGAF